jgi:hypothetical protein
MPLMLTNKLKLLFGASLASLMVGAQAQSETLPEAVAAAFATNPQLEIIDIAAVAEIAHAGGASLTVDNVFATPLLQSPLELGADCVVYSVKRRSVVKCNWDTCQSTDFILRNVDVPNFFYCNRKLVAPLCCSSNLSVIPSRRNTFVIII